MSDDSDNAGEDPLRDSDWLREQYVERAKTQQEIADTLAAMDGVEHRAPRTVSRWLHRHGIETRDPGGGRPLADDRLADADWLRARYHGDGLTGQEIADRLDCSASTVYRALERHGIDRRRPNAPPVGGVES